MAPFRHKVLGSLLNPIHDYFHPSDYALFPSQAFPSPPPETASSLRAPYPPHDNTYSFTYSSFRDLGYNRIHQTIEHVSSTTAACQTEALMWQLSELDYFRYEDPSSTIRRIRERREVWGEAAEVFVICSEGYWKFFREITTKRKYQDGVLPPFALPLPHPSYLPCSLNRPPLGALVAVVARQQVRMQCTPTLLLSYQRLPRQWKIECTCYADTEISVLPENHIPSEAEKRSTVYRPDLERFTHV